MVGWFDASLIAMLCISAGWLILKKVQLKGISHEDSLALFLVFNSATIIAWHLLSKTPFVFAPFAQGAFLVGAAVFGAISNLLMLHSFERSANPGLTLALSATQVLWLTIAGIALFDASLTVLAGIGILLVISGVALMHVRSLTGDFNWGVLAIGAGVMSATYWVIVKGVNAATGLLPTMLLLYVSVPQILVFFIVKKCRPRAKHQPFSLAVLGLLALCGAIGALGNSLNIFAITTAPNPGYALAVSSAGILVTLLASVPLFNAKVGWRQALATLLIVAGVIAVRLGS
jgi:drug/metabolite transporter (DMT)-like permease